MGGYLIREAWFGPESKSRFLREMRERKYPCNFIVFSLRVITGKDMRASQTSPYGKTEGIADMRGILAALILGLPPQ